jgi:hypothetical protein
MSTNSILATAPLVTTNFLLRATGTTIGNSLIFDNGTNVGIGNTNTTYKLDVSGTGNFTGALSGTSATFSDVVNLASAGNQTKLSWLGYNSAYTKITSDVGFDSTYNGTYITNNTNSAGNAQGNTLISSWQLSLGASDSFKISRSPSGSFTFANLFSIASTGAATFTGNVVLSASDSRFNGGDSVGRLIMSNSNTTTYIGLYGATHPTLPYVMSFVVNSASALSIASTGAATFSSGIGTLGYTASTSYAALFNGSVGIGTTTPETLLHVNSSNAGGEGGYIYLDNPAASILNNKSGIKFGTSSGASFSTTPTGEISNIVTNAGTGASDLTFGTFNGSSSGERMRITSGGDISTNGGSGSAGVSTATPKNFRFNNDYSNGYTDASLKMYLYNSGATIQGFTSGPSFDLQYHSSGDNTNGRHVWYIGNTEVMKIQSSSGNVTIAGSLSKGSGSFRIEHPLPSLSETHQLVHSFIEGPQADLIYRGKLTLVNGKAQANIDEVSTMTEGTFEALCRDIQCFTTNESGWDLIKGKVIGNIIYIESQNEKSTDEISWMVIGERKDKHMMDTEWTDENGKVIVEPLKPIEQEPMEDLTEVVEPIAEVTPEPTDNNLE